MPKINRGKLLVGIIFGFNLKKNVLKNIRSVFWKIHPVILFLFCDDKNYLDFLDILNSKHMILKEVCLIIPLKKNKVNHNVNDGIIESGFSMYLCFDNKIKHDVSFNQNWSNIWTYNVEDFSNTFVLNEPLVTLCETFVYKVLQTNFDIVIWGKDESFQFEAKKHRYQIFVICELPNNNINI